MSRIRSNLLAIPGRYDIVVEASPYEPGWRDALTALRAGGVCTATGYYLGSGTKLPVMHMYATSVPLNVGVSHVRPLLPELLDFVATTDSPPSWVTSLLADWEDAADAYTERTT